ncbi:MAG: hypothetical protein LBV40_08020 [Methanomicrobiales archaeon]|jgi:hypothetical protein|nr:hypothetical protein [Methanomicrobiales archaeon]
MLYHYKTVAYGGEPSTPNIAAITTFLQEHPQYRKRCFDLISYQIATQILAEKEAGIEQIGSGGLFVKSRIEEAIHYNEEWHLVDPTWLLYDAEQISFLSKHSQYSFPSPNLLPSRYEEEAEAYYSLCKQYRTVMREMRDRGVYKHVLIATQVDETLCEELIGRRSSVFMTRDAKREDIECVLEYQQSISLYDSSILESLLDQFSISTVTLLDPTEKNLIVATEHLDQEKIRIGGYNDGTWIKERGGVSEEEKIHSTERDYWDMIKEKSRGQF